ncbi:energy-coupling factor transporter transmembrane component T family protein [Fodinicola acaciae]|uniref:energy-coupling factor transporter transmembrane component T family protein n=1 Tax=Fodinicola acaciae TaxID=2681555 RepID=UPI0013D6EC12|nr:energy-coupling factor transporter transmembrane protein EcfT [Fodinicola acaciae]
MSLLGLYHPASSPLHRLPPAAKLIALLVAAIGIFFVTSPIWTTVAAVASLLLYALARIPVRLAVAQLRPVAVVFVFVFAMQWLLAGLPTAVLVCTRLIALIALAGLTTLTTRTTDLVATIERVIQPLSRLGVDPTRFGLLVALTLRSVPVLAEIAGDIREAQRARGVAWSVRGFVLPFVIRTLRRTESLGEALAARGVDDD